MAIVFGAWTGFGICWALTETFPIASFGFALGCTFFAVLNNK